jgi:phosphatidylinositol glycan class A protein
MQNVTMHIAKKRRTTMRKDPSRKHRIAMVCDFFYPRLGGVENHIWSLSQHLIAAGHKVIVVTHGYDGGRRGVRYLPGPLKVYHAPVVPVADQSALPTFTATLPLIRSILLREGIEIVHAHQATSAMANESVVYAASMMGLASVYTDHSLFGFADVAGVVLNGVLRTTLPACVDAAVCVSHTCRDNFVLRTNVSPRRVRVIPNAVCSEDFTPDPSQRCEDRIKVVVISRLVYRKGVDLLVGIIPAVCRLRPNVDFIIGGDGSKMLALQEMVERERLEERVEFLGSVPHANVRSVLVRGHVFLNCSLTESFCIAILEAASCGLLVVSTNVGGVPEVLPRDMIVLSEPVLTNMVEAVARAAARQSHADTAVDPARTHERVRRMYSWRRVAEETVEVYDQILRRPRRSFLERLECYRRQGVVAGPVVCFLAVTVQLWYHFVEWWFPRHAIDRVPDLVVAEDPKPSSDDETKVSRSLASIRN